MKQYPLTTLPERFHADEISDDGVYLKCPQTIEGGLELLHLLREMIQAEEVRNRYLGRSSEVRNECVLHIREMALNLQQEGVSPYTGVSRLAFPELGRPA